MTTWLNNEYIYLGILFKYNGNFVHTQILLAKQGRKSLFQLYNRIHDDCFNHETTLSLFDTYIKYFELFMSTVGRHKSEDVEKVH